MNDVYYGSERIANEYKNNQTDNSIDFLNNFFFNYDQRKYVHMVRTISN